MRALSLALALLASTVARAEETTPPPRRQAELRYLVSGSVLLGVFYALPLALAIRYEEGELALPIFGPLVELRRCRACTASPVEQGVVAGLVLDAALQAAGASLLIVGVVRRRPVRLSLAPTAGGLIVKGRF